VASYRSTGEILDGLWRFEARSPDWTEKDDDWQPEVAWWAVKTANGLVLIDPLVEDWDQLDKLVSSNQHCAAIVRTTYWHQRTIPQASERYDAEVWAMPAPADAPPCAFSQAVDHGQQLPGDLHAFSVSRQDELALWLPKQSALLFGDVLLRARNGTLQLCPESWLDPPHGGSERLLTALKALPEVPLEHVLVSHGPLVLGDGRSALAQALYR
jgi:hypothetical protein